ncbi:hypothetical protein [Neobacillus terrae]|nr:hypothetical protein [Neobacillus terrae]NHM30762.1 hypothetical protein [Neobacillus terrae]
MGDFLDLFGDEKNAENNNSQINKSNQGNEMSASSQGNHLAVHYSFIKKS